MIYRKLYQQIASLIDARNNCRKSNNIEWMEKHSEALKNIEKNYLPSGSGIDCGTKILLDECKPNKIVLFAEFHHMNDCGMYDGWTEHKIIITPSLTSDIDIRIGGRDRNDIKEYLSEVYSYCLDSIDYSIDSLFDILFERIKAKQADNEELLKNLYPKSEWIDNCTMQIKCLDKTFKDWQSAKLASIEAMEALEEKKA